MLMARSSSVSAGCATPRSTTRRPRPTAFALNEIAGVDIPEADIRGWPRFPIRVLEDPLNLAKLVAVLDRLATATRPQTTVAEQGHAVAERA